MPIVVDDNIPDFLREFLTSQGVISVRDTETGETGVVPIQPRRRPRPNTGGFEAAGGDDFDDPSLPEGTGSVDIFDTLRGLFSSEDPSFTSAELNQFNAPQETSENSVLDKAANLFTGFGQLVEDGLGKIGGLFNTDGNNALGAYGGNVPSNIMGRINPAFTDTTLSTDRLVGQALGTGLLGAATQVIPGVNIFGLGASLLSGMGFHHDYNPSRDSNLNFDVTSGRFEWDSLDPGGGGVQYGSKPNEQMIIDEANENPNERFNVTWQDEEGNQKTGNISFGEARDVLSILNDPFFAGDTQEVWDAFTFSGPTFGSQKGLGNMSNQDAINTFDAGMGGDIWNSVASSVYDQGGGYDDIQGPASAARAAYDLGVAPTQSAIDTMVDESLSGKGLWDPATLAMSSMTDLDMSMGDLDPGGYDFDAGTEDWGGPEDVSGWDYF